MSAAPMIAVVVPTRNRAAKLPILLEHLRRQTFEDFEVVVVDDSSTDGTAAALERAACAGGGRIRVWRTPRPSGAAAARNLGWRSTEAAMVAFTDDDCRPEPGWLAALAERFDDAQVLQGVTRHDPAEAEGRGPFSQIVEVMSFSGQFETSNVAYPRRVLEALGGFDEGFEGDSFGEDVDLGWRALEAGAEAAFVEDAVVVHETKRGPGLTEVRAAIRDARRWRRIGRVLREHPGYRSHRLPSGPFLMETHPPTWLALAGLVAACLRPRRRPIRFVALVAALPWVRHRLLVQPRPGRRRHQVMALPVSFVVDATEAVTVAISGARSRTLVL